MNITPQNSKTNNHRQVLSHPALLPRKDKALRSHGSGEKELEKDLMRRLAARRKEIRMARKASSQSSGVADGSCEEVKGSSEDCVEVSEGKRQDVSLYVSVMCRQKCGF